MVDNFIYRKLKIVIQNDNKNHVVFTYICAMKKGSKLYSILFLRCPRCQNSPLFQEDANNKGILAMPSRCAACAQSFNLEPGFYWGSMYVGYLVSSFIILSAFAILFFGFSMDIEKAMGIAILFIILLFIPIFRYSRAIWINVFVHFDSKFII